MQIFGFEEIEAPNFGDFKVIWLNLPSAFPLHLIERNPSTKLPEGPYSATSAVADPSHIRRGHHICFSVSNFESFVQTLKVLSLLSLSLFFFFCQICLNEMENWAFYRKRVLRIFRVPYPIVE